MRARAFRLLSLLSLIAGTANALPVTLVWDPPVGYTPGGYAIGYGQFSGAYTTVVDVGAARSYTTGDLAAGQTYYFSEGIRRGPKQRMVERGRHRRTRRAAAAFGVDIPRRWSMGQR